MNNTPSSIQRVALVSGGGTGIGRAICLRLARDGLKVVVVWSRSAEGARQTVASIEAAGGTACALRANIAEETDVQSLFAAVQACYGRLDVLINNAGIGHMKSFENISMAAYDQIFSVNARGTFTTRREAARCIEAGGRIVNISSGITVANSEGMALICWQQGCAGGFFQSAGTRTGTAWRNGEYRFTGYDGYADARRGRCSHAPQGGRESGCDETAGAARRRC